MRSFGAGSPALGPHSSLWSDSRPRIPPAIIIALTEQPYPRSTLWSAFSLLYAWILNPAWRRSLTHLDGKRSQANKFMLLISSPATKRHLNWNPDKQMTMVLTSLTHNAFARCFTRGKILSIENAESTFLRSLKRVTNARPSEVTKRMDRPSSRETSNLANEL